MRRDKLLIISGSRDWTDETLIRELLLWFDPEWTLVVHGKCRTGADAIADRIAVELGFTILRCPAPWRSKGYYDPGAGPERNEDMQRIGIKNQRHGVAVHAGIFPLPQSKGTKHMHRLCQLAGFDIYIPVACKYFL